jgi:hypothetical protein
MRLLYLLCWLLKGYKFGGGNYFTWDIKGGGANSLADHFKRTYPSTLRRWAWGTINTKLNLRTGHSHSLVAKNTLIPKSPRTPSPQVLPILWGQNQCCAHSNSEKLTMVPTCYIWTGNFLQLKITFSIFIFSYSYKVHEMRFFILSVSDYSSTCSLQGAKVGFRQ